MSGECFLDESAIEAGERFSVRLADALLESRVVVVFASPEYFQRRTCLWELRAALGPYDLSPDPRQLQHMVVVLPPEGVPEELERLPPGLQAGNWLTTADPDGIARMIRARLSRPSPTLGERYEALGQPMSAVRARLLELTARPPTTTLTGVCTVYGLAEVPLHDDFVGRWDELHRADFWLRTAFAGPGTAAPTVCIEGLGGLGKTRLAAEYVYRFGARAFPGGILWFDAGKPLEPQFHGALRALDPAAPSLGRFISQGRDARAELEIALRVRFTRQPILMVVDNVPESGGNGAAPRSLGEYCPAVGHVATLVTSRRRLSLEPGRRGLLLRELDPTSAVQLLTRGAPPGQLSSKEWTAIASWVGCLPLALTLLNQVLLSGHSARALLDAAQTGGITEMLDGQMEALRAEVEPGSLRGVTEALSISYRQLLPATQRASRLLAQLAPTSIPLALVERMPEIFTLQVRSQLLRRCFVTPHEIEPSRVPMFGSMHRITADYLRTCESTAEEQQRIEAALCELLDGEATGPDQWHLWQACVEHAAHYLRLTGERSAPLQLAVSRALLGLGRRLEALETTQRLVEFCRRASTTDDTALSNLALALAVRRDGLRELSRWDEELRALEELVEVLRSWRLAIRVNSSRAWRAPWKRSRPD